MGVLYRPAGEADRTYLYRLNLLAETLGDDTAPITDPAAFRAGADFYVGAWEPAHGGIIAVDPVGIPAGGAWLCHGPGGLGFVREGTPELSLAVEARFRGLGIGRELLDRVVALAGEAGVSLAVHDDNEVARRLYVSAGFAFVRRLAGEPYTVWELNSHR